MSKEFAEGTPLPAGDQDVTVIGGKDASGNVKALVVNADGSLVSPSAASNQTVTTLSTTGSSSIAAGKSAILVANVGGAAGTLGGQTFPAGAAVALDKGPYAALAYNATGTTFFIVTVG